MVNSVPDKPPLVLLFVGTVVPPFLQRSDSPPLFQCLDNDIPPFTARVSNNPQETHFVPMRIGADITLFQGLNRLYWLLGLAKNPIAIRRITEKYVRDRDQRAQLHFLVYRIYVAAGRHLETLGNVNFGQQAFEDAKASIFLKRKAIIELAYQHHLTDEHDEYFDDNFDRGLAAIRKVL